MPRIRNTGIEVMVLNGNQILIKAGNTASDQAIIDSLVAYASNLKYPENINPADVIQWARDDTFRGDRPACDSRICRLLMKICKGDVRKLVCLLIADKVGTASPGDIETADDEILNRIWYDLGMKFGSNENLPPHKKPKPIKRRPRKKLQTPQ